MEIKGQELFHGLFEAGNTVQTAQEELFLPCKPAQRRIAKRFNVGCPQRNASDKNLKEKWDCFILAADVEATSQQNLCHIVLAEWSLDII